MEPSMCELKKGRKKMKEKRENRRIDMECQLVVNRIDNGKEGEITIDVQDVSRNGMGFISNQALEIDSVYEAHVTIWTKEVIHTLLRIVRSTVCEGGFLYGSVFVGLSEVDAFRIAVYDMVEWEKRKVT